MTPPEELFGKYHVAIAEGLRDAPPIVVEFDAYQAFVLVSQLQFALRGPQPGGESREVALAIAEQFSQALIHLVPAIKPLIDAGWVVDGKCCRECGCTEDNACEGGCSWVEDTLCSRCAGSVILDPMGLPARRIM